MYNVTIVGAGQLGSRHLQGLSKVDININISVVDPNNNSLQLARSRFNEMRPNDNILSINYQNNIKDTPNSIDLCIVSCNSDVRRKVVEELLYEKK